MNIALINSEYPQEDGSQGGIASFTYTLATALTDLGCKVHVLIRKGTVPQNLSPAVEVHHFEFRSAKGIKQFVEKKFQNGAVTWEKGHSRHIRQILLTIHKQEKLNVVQIPEYGGLAYSLKPPLPFKIIVRFSMPSKLIDMINGKTTSNKRANFYRFESKAIKNASAFISPTKALQRWLHKHMNIADIRFSVIKSPIDTRDFGDKRSYKSKTLKKILYVGRLEQRKGAGIIARYITDILKIDPKITITFAGEVEKLFISKVKQTIAKNLGYKECSRVLFLGAVNHQEISELYKKSGILIVPSLMDNCPNTLLEGMASGLPIVCSDAEGIKEFINHGSNGLVFPLKNPQLLTTMISHIINNPRLASALGKSALQYISKNHEIMCTGKEFLSLYKSVSN
ncbi:glycosyltransferase family 4 protein [Chitinispirillales bacterium ANBcel5]|uniref:glycosyltransferase family 4 protein n=1 Tax=Cellulosispirillum alkaliphilum TaxID=3039283 RepID=UPI002A4F3096|nr:glycosyltransferase family 4 protein [Chitinispirillales bacterium ANBcel5]